MEALIFVMLAAILVSAGVGMTVVMARRMPVEVLVRAQAHGRFAGLGALESHGGSRKALRPAVGAQPVAA